jgi:hypothetical protein
VARRRADRDPAVQPAGEAVEHALAELVGRAPAGVGVEGRDVDRLRLAQQDEREEGHERLVEVEDVEALALEHLAHQVAVARREGQRPDRAVGRHAEAVAEPDDVALALSLRAVGAADDPHVVAASDQVLVQVATWPFTPPGSG